MSRPLHQWIAIRKERRKVDGQIRELLNRVIHWAPMSAQANYTAFIAAVYFIAWRCDVEWYAIHGESLTGANWIKGENHPIPCYPR